MHMQRAVNMRRLALLGIVLLVAAGGCTTNPATGKRQLLLIDREQEIALGEEAAPQFEQQFEGAVEDPTLQNYVTDVGMRVAAKSHRPMPYEFRLVKSGVPNAFALPGGKIFITAGLMSRMTNERQLAAVLGHETGHVAALHNVSGMQRQMGAQVLAEAAGAILGGDKGSAAKTVTEVVGTMANLSYSRGDEYEADQLGIDYMAAAGYNPYGMVELLGVLKGLSDGEPGTFGEMMQTHPLTSKRIEQATAAVKDRHAGADPKAPDPNEARFRRMHARLLSAVKK